MAADSALGADASPPPPRPKKPRSQWRALVPVPAAAPAADFAHDYRKADTLVGTYEYRFNDVLYGHVARFVRSTGVPVHEARTWCVDHADGRGLAAWRWKDWEDEFRPLYVPATLLSGDPGRVPVVVVGDERHALAGHKLLGHEFDFVSWHGSDSRPGVAWSWLHGRTVYLWPTCHASRQARTADEVREGVAIEAKAVLPEARQLGFKAMQRIGMALVGLHDAKVFLCRTPAPGAVPHGWGLADAIEGGWGPLEVRGMIRGAWSFEARAVANDAAAKAASLFLPAPAAAGPGQGAEPPLDDSIEPAWVRRLWRGAGRRKEDCRDNVYLFLTNHSDLKGLVAYDLFSHRVLKMRSPPWGGPPGEWSDNDDHRLGLWLMEHARMPIKAERTLLAGVAMAAMDAQIHPVRDWFDALPAWDPEREPERLAHWLHECLGAADTSYTRMVGTWFVMGIAARILNPGCQMDYMIVLEGLQGKLKSTALKTLAIRREWFADTPIRIGDKDALLSLAGILLYEIAELDAFSRAEVTAVKQYITSQVDRVREPYGRRFVDRPRSGVLAGSTNQSEYFKDVTGNRRMWPVACDGMIDLAKLREWLPRLYAEALWRLRYPGDDADAADMRRYWPTLAETKTYFEPQQEQREIVDAWYEVLAQWVDSPRKFADTIEEVRARDSFTSHELLAHALHVPVDRIDGGRQMTTRVGQAMNKLRWVRKRDAAPPRLWRYWRPAGPLEGDGGDGVVPGAAGPSGDVDEQGDRQPDADSLQQTNAAMASEAVHEF